MGGIKRVKILTDSAHDLPASVVERFGITIVPMMVYFGDLEFKDGVTLSTADFYRRFAAGPHLPKTSTPLMDEMRTRMEFLTEDGSELVVVLLSSALSSTYSSSALIAAQMPERRITVIDSRSASLGEGLLVWRAAEMAEAGASAQEIEADLGAFIPRLIHLFTVDTLEYLMKGGRINKVEAMVGSMLDVKPILYVDGEGAVLPLGKVRGRRKAVGRLVEIVERRIKSPDAQRVGVIHAHCPEEGEELAATLRRRLGIKETVLTEMGPTIATHAGPGLLGIVFSGAGRDLSLA